MGAVGTAQPLLILRLFTMDGCTEREKGELHDFKALQSPRDTDYGDTVSNSHEQVGDCELPAPEQQPQDIGDGV